MNATTGSSSPLPEGRADGRATYLETLRTMTGDPEVLAAAAATETAPVTSWEDENACHGAHLIQPGHWTMEPHHYLRCHSPAPVVGEREEKP